MNKNLPTFLIILFVFFSIAKAQNPENQKIHIGFKGGFTASVFTKNVVPFDKNAPGYADSRFSGWANDFYSGFNFGLTFDYRISKSFTLATELDYHERGAMYSKKSDNVVLTDSAGNQSDAYDHYNYNLYYLEVPIILQYHISKGADHASSRVYAGISPAILLAGNSSYKYYKNNDDTGEADVLSEDKQLSYIRGLQVSPVIGFWLGDTNVKHKAKLFLDFRFEYSFFSAFNRASIDGANLQTNIYSVDSSIGLRF